MSSSRREQRAPGSRAVGRGRRAAPRRAAGPLLASAVRDRARRWRGWSGRPPSRRGGSTALPALEAQRGGVGGDVGARLVDDERSRPSGMRTRADLQPVGARVHSRVTAPTGSGSAATSSTAEPASRAAPRRAAGGLAWARRARSRARDPRRSPRGCPPRARAAMRRWRGAQRCAASCRARERAAGATRRLGQGACSFVHRIDQIVSMDHHVRARDSRAGAAISWPRWPAARRSSSASKPHRPRAKLRPLSSAISTGSPAPKSPSTPRTPLASRDLFRSTSARGPLVDDDAAADLQRIRDPVLARLAGAPRRRGRWCRAALRR